MTLIKGFYSQGYTLFNICSLISVSYGKSGSDRLPLLLYQACFQPLNSWSMPMFTVMPVNQIFIYLLETVWILGNLYLCRFLQKNTDRREGKLTFVFTMSEGVDCSLILFFLSYTETRCEKGKKEEFDSCQNWSLFSSNFHNSFH